MQKAITVGQSVIIIDFPFVLIIKIKQKTSKLAPITKIANEKSSPGSLIAKCTRFLLILIMHILHTRVTLSISSLLFIKSYAIDYQRHILFFRYYFIYFLIIPMLKKVLSQNLFNYVKVSNMTELNSKLKEIKTPYLLDFYADWCGPCKMLTPVLEKRQKESEGKWTLIKINVDEEALAEVVNAHQVTGIPLLAFYDKDGKLLNKRAGFVDDKGFQALETTYLK